MHNKILELNKFLNNTKKILNQSGGLKGMEKESKKQLEKFVKGLKNLEKKREELNVKYIKKRRNY